MANPQEYTYTAAGARTVEARGDYRDQIFRISIEETPILSLLPHRSITDNQPKTLEESLEAIDTGNAFAEGSVAPAAVSAARSIVYNYAQLFKKTVTVSDVQQAIAQYGMGQEYDHQLGLRTIAIKKDVEACLISDQAAQAATPANGRVGKMKGMDAWITTNTNTVINFNQANFETLVHAVFALGGDASQVWFDMTRKVAASAWTPKITRYQTDRPGLMLNQVQEYETMGGMMAYFHVHRYMPQNFVGTAAVCFELDLQKSGWEVLELIPFTVAPLPYTGAGESCQLQWMVSNLCGAEKANFAFKD